MTRWELPDDGMPARGRGLPAAKQDSAEAGGVRRPPPPGYGRPAGSAGAAREPDGYRRTSVPAPPQRELEAPPARLELPAAPSRDEPLVAPRRPRSLRRVILMRVGVLALIALGTAGALTLLPSSPATGSAPAEVSADPTPTITVTVTAGSSGTGIAQVGDAGTQAAAWIAGQVASSSSVSCDQEVSDDLRAAGFRGGTRVVGAGGVNAVAQSDIAVVTPALARNLGPALAPVLAAEPAAVFGTGADAVQVFAVAKNGSAQADLAARRSAATAVLNNPDVEFVTPGLRDDVANDLIDSQVLTALNAAANGRVVRVAGFGAPAPGAAPDVPLRGLLISRVDGTPAGGDSASATALVAALQGADPLPVQKIVYDTVPSVSAVFPLVPGNAATGSVTPTP